MRDRAGGRADHGLFPKPLGRIFDLAVEPQKLGQRVKRFQRRQRLDDATAHDVETAWLPLQQKSSQRRNCLGAEAHHLGESAIAVVKRFQTLDRACDADMPRRIPYKLAVR
jgi:hypothetical protein